MSFKDNLFWQGKKLIFVTNNSTKSRKKYAKKFQMLGVAVSEVMSKSHSFSIYLL